MDSKQLDHSNAGNNTSDMKNQHKGKLNLNAKLGSHTFENLGLMRGQTQQLVRDCFINHQIQHCIEDDYTEPAAAPDEKGLVDGFLNMKINDYGRVIEQQLSKGLQTLQLKVHQETLEPKSRSGLKDPTSYNTGGNASPRQRLRLVHDDRFGSAQKNSNSLYKNYQQFLSNKTNLDAHLLKFKINAN